MPKTRSIKKIAVKNLLLEIGCEELPVAHQEYIRRNYSCGPKLEGISHGEVKVLTTPRRIVFYIENLAPKESDRQEKVFGPPKNVAYGKDGILTGAALGFAKAQGIDPQDIKIEKKGNGEYICAIRSTKGRDTISFLRETLPSFLESIWFEKTMRWEARGFKFSRPVRWIACLYGDKVVNFQAFGAKAANFTFGNRLASNKKLIIKEADLENYKEVLKKQYVIVDHREREETIVGQINKIAKQSINNFEILIQEVSGLIEYPTAIKGTFPQEFLKLPQEIVETCMMGHERFFPIRDNNGLKAEFISITNNPFSSARKNILKGNEAVLIARLSDSKYFYEQDVKDTIDKRLEKLKSIIFQGGMGSMYDKANRLSEMSKFICSSTPVLNNSKDKCARAALLSKIDIGTNVVNEFSSLQGVMGRIYAQRAGEDKEVAQAIEDQYRPANDTKINRSVGVLGAIVGVADKIDNICAFFAQGFKATGSEDPYGARRDAQGLLDILMNGEMNIRKISINDLIDRELELIADKISNKDAKNEIISFIKQRIQTFFKINAIEYDEADAVMKIALAENLHTAVVRAKVIQKFRKDPSFEKFIVAFKRVINILEQSKKQGIEINSLKLETVLLKEDAEKELYNIYLDIKDDVSGQIKQGNFEKAMEELLSNFAKPIDNFFEKVMVMVDDEALKKNRLSLLFLVSELFFLIADFSKIVLSEALEGKK